MVTLAELKMTGNSIPYFTPSDNESDRLPSQRMPNNGLVSTIHKVIITHHRHHSEEQSNDPENRSFIDQLAQSILSNLQQTDETAASSPADSSSPPNGSGVSSIDGLTNIIADNLLAKYLQASDTSLALSSTSPPTQVNTIA